MKDRDDSRSGAWAFGAAAIAAFVLAMPIAVCIFMLFVAYAGCLFQCQDTGTDWPMVVTLSVVIAGLIVDIALWALAGWFRFRLAFVLIAGGLLTVMAAPVLFSIWTGAW